MLQPVYSPLHRLRYIISLAYNQNSSFLTYHSRTQNHRHSSGTQHLLSLLYTPLTCRPKYATHCPTCHPNPLPPSPWFINARPQNYLTCPLAPLSPWETDPLVNWVSGQKLLPNAIPDWWVWIYAIMDYNNNIYTCMYVYAYIYMFMYMIYCMHYTV